MKNLNDFINQLKFYFFIKKKLKDKSKQVVKNNNLILIEYFKYKASFIPFTYFAKILKKNIIQI